jgi:hypothetical protein
MEKTGKIKVTLSIKSAKIDKQGIVVQMHKIAFSVNGIYYEFHIVWFTNV